MIGNVFGYLTVQSQTISKGPRKQWICMCECGRECIYTTRALTSGDAKSCKCKQYGKRPKSVTRNHLQYLYQAWSDMKQRCYNPKNWAYKYYGDRGIKVCNEWKTDFKQFMFDMGERPSKDYSLDRIDNDKGYYKGNCRWATRAEQQQNKGAYRR